MKITVCLLLFCRVSGKSILVRVIIFDETEEKYINLGFKSTCILNPYFLEK